MLDLIIPKHSKFESTIDLLIMKYFNYSKMLKRIIFKSKN